MSTHTAFQGGQSSVRQYFGKYRGKVLENTDPLFQGRIIAYVPSILGSNDNWAMPCVPYAGFNVGFYAIPPIEANVWIEFEGGDPNYPIWTGCFWGPEDILRVPEPVVPEIKVFKTDFVTLILNDLPEIGGFSISCNPVAVDIPLTMTFNSVGITISCPESTIAMTPASITLTIPEAEAAMTPASITLTVPESVIMMEPALISIDCPAASIDLTPESIVIEAPLLDITAVTDITGAVAVEGAVEIAGAVAVEGAVDIAGAMAVEGAVVIAGGLAIEGGGTIDGAPIL